MERLKTLFFVIMKKRSATPNKRRGAKISFLEKKTYFNISFILATKSAYTSARLISFKIS